MAAVGMYPIMAVDDDVTYCCWVLGAGSDNAWLLATVSRPSDIRWDRTMMLGVGPEITSLTVWRQ